jgi:hypothetical protein
VIADLDCDGFPELVIRNEGSHFQPHALPAPRTPLSAFGLDYAAIEHGTGDLDNDGCDDLSFYNFGKDNLSYLYLGWPIPWDEAEWW